MRIDEIDIFGKKTPSFEELVSKYKDTVSKDELQAQYDKGTQIELEHVDDIKVAQEIARDHLNEMPDYYDKLEKIEKK